MNWTQTVTQETGGEVIAIDGKTAKGSRDRKNHRNPLHMVSAWACNNRLVLGQQATDEKSNDWGSPQTALSAGYAVLTRDLDVLRRVPGAKVLAFEPNE